jgi:hypothetical protein
MDTDTRAPLFNRWTWGAVGLTIAPLILWGAASVFLLAVACGIPAYLAWIPSASTTGVMLVSSIFAMTESLSREVRTYARTLAYSAIGLDTLVSGLHLALPVHLSPAMGWLLLIGMLPPLTGGITGHMIATAVREHRGAIAAAIADRLATEQARRDQDAATAHAEHLATIARAEADARRIADEADARKRAAAAAVVNAALTGPTLVRPPAPKPARRTGKPTLRDAAVAELVRRHRAGKDIATTVAAELDTAIGAGRGYCKKFLPDVIEHVLTAEQRTA